MVTLSVESNWNYTSVNQILARKVTIMSRLIPILYKKIPVTIQVDRNNSVCDFVFPGVTLPPRSIKNYDTAKIPYEELIKHYKDLRSDLLNLYRGRPISIVLNLIQL